MLACTPATFDDMLLAPSYPWPCILRVKVLFSFKNWSITSEIAAPIICCKNINANNSSLKHGQMLYIVRCYLIRINIIYNIFEDYVLTRHLY